MPPRRLATFLPLLRSELGRSVESVFTELDPTPLASASLAQVHRGRLRDGREVAVKIQYPDIEHVVRVDLKSFAVLIGLDRCALKPDSNARWRSSYPVCPVSAIRNIGVSPTASRIRSAT